MKVENVKKKSSFAPIKVQVTIESQDELDMFSLMTRLDETIPSTLMSNYGFAIKVNPNNKSNCVKFLSKFRDSIRQHIV